MLTMGTLVSSFLVASGWQFLMLLFLAPCVSGASGATARMLWAERTLHSISLRSTSHGTSRGQYRQLSTLRLRLQLINPRSLCLPLLRDGLPDLPLIMCSPKLSRLTLLK